MRSNKFFIGCGIAVIAVLVFSIAGLVLGNFLIPEVSQQIPPTSDQVFVNITQPVNGASLPVNQPLTIFVEAFGDKSIQGINLLVNGVQVPAGVSSPAGKEKLISSWTFTPDKEGTVTLLASAISGGGSESTSNAVNIQIVPPDQVPIALVEGGLTPP